MKLKKLSCTQFAGIRDRDITLTDGVNIIYGKNESGKSTLVNLISRTLFQNARIDNRKDKEFKDLYFPSARKNGAAVGDFADGKLTFEADGGTYTLSKEWGVDARTALSTPDGVIRDADSIERILRDVLIYGEGVYSEMLLSSQRNTDYALETILDTTNKADAKKELTEAISTAFSESNGISVDAIGQAIDAKIEEIVGKHWDTERGIPDRNPRGRWSKELGEILKAYYAYEDAVEVLNTISRLEKENDFATSDYIAKDAAVIASENDYDSFIRLQNQIKTRKFNLDTKLRLEKELKKISDILAGWPKLSEKLESAKMLQTEKNYRELIDKYYSAKKISDEINPTDYETATLTCPTDTEIAQVKSAERGITKLESMLCGMNINAGVNMQGNNEIQIVSLRTGERISISDGIAEITEAVKITIPDVVELQLSPANVDIDYINQKIKAQINGINGIFSKYGVDSVEALELLANKIKTACNKIEGAKSRLAIILGDTDFITLQTQAMSVIGKARSADEIEQDILSVCGNKDVARYVTEKETTINNLINEHSSIEALKDEYCKKSAEYDAVSTALQSADDIPLEFLSISDPDAFLNNLQMDLKLKKSSREDALKRKASASGMLESYKETLSYDPQEHMVTSKRVFEEAKALLSHWIHIKEVYNSEKQKINDNPMQDIVDGFVYYLNIISSGKISSDFPDSGKLNINIYSDNSLLDYGKLSEGTKETVSLAFRLAVLEHLFPEGGGVIVLDDPLTDMDAERAEQSCKLIAECAKRHQVIFLTCREEYADMLGGNLIAV